MMRTLTKLTVKNVDFKALDMDDEGFEKIDIKKCGLPKFLIWMMRTICQLPIDEYK